MLTCFIDVVMCNLLETFFQIKMFGSDKTIYNGIFRLSANQLEALLENIRNNTNCPCSRFICQKDNRGYQIGISLVRKMEVDE